MNSTAAISPQAPGAIDDKRLLTIRGGGWILLVAAALSVVFCAWIAWRAWVWTSTRPPGDGQTPASYLFDLSNPLVPSDSIKAGHYYREFRLALTQPSLMDGSDVAAFNEEVRGKYLVSNDRVIGVEIGGEARAYPLFHLNIHSVVNDTLGGRDIAVTYDPLCDSVVVFDRQVGGRVREFGVSGLFVNSNMLLFDRNEGPQPRIGGESLWSQLYARAVTGPAAAEAATLEVLSCALTTWEDWLKRHPQTSVLKHPRGNLKPYKEANYSRYFARPDFVLPVGSLPEMPSGLTPKSRVVVVTLGSEEKVLTLHDLENRADASGRVSEAIGGIPVQFQLVGHDEARSVVLDTPVLGDIQPAIVYCLWFAWYAR